RRSSVREARFRGVLPRLRLETRVAIHEADAGVPAQDGVVVARGGERHRSLVPAHRLEEPPRGHARVRAALELRLGPSLGDDSREIGALVFALELAQNLMALADAHR